MYLIRHRIEKKKKKKKATYQLAKMLMHDYGGWVGG